MTVETVLKQTEQFFNSGDFKKRLAQRIAYQTESQQQPRSESLNEYLQQVIQPELEAMGFTTTQIANPVLDNCPFLIAERIEDPALPTILCYGHGDVVFGDAENWREGLSPWEMVEEGDRWYGRGTADNKGQHTINFAALEQVYKARGGKLGFNCKVYFEMGEEISSPGLAEIATQYRDKLSADIFIASDGPRLTAERPTLFLGSRGCINFKLSIDAREQGYHSGNWGGLLSNPGTQLANAIACLVDKQGRILVDGLKPPAVSPAIREILSDIEPAGQPGDPEIDLNWGEPSLTPAERLFSWNSLEVLAFTTGNPQRPVNAIPPKAHAVCQLRFVVGTDTDNIIKNIEQHLKQHGFNNVDVESYGITAATRFDPTDPLVNWTLDVITQSTNKKPALLPNLGGSLPNDIFADILGLPTLWIPHSYPACGQHAVNEHMLKPIASEGLQIMTRLFWELGEHGKELIAQHKQHQKNK
ncbi:M20 family metallopeptidase [Zophobihabitans entericus]|uniref:M20 family metallopeptidase n=1 Tax=Zophobihabitans entericus TaxID=1635327 RepID=A0A6G9IC25_9GAMM|nr:M20 family metallopeptidase [Zophobihabitans entericus]QIQ21387.1 M20 family metallopeptidase [Zophobihabitans entericus]